MRKNKEEIIGISVALFVTLFMLWVTRWRVYIEVQDNVFFITLLVFMICVVFGYGIVKLFNIKKKDRFITD